MGVWVAGLYGPVSDAAYDATSWNGVTTIAPSKNAVRDKLATLEGALPTTYVPVLNPRAYGAVGDGVTDDSAAFVAWNAAMRATDIPDVGEPGARITQAQGYIPPGRYLITTPEALLTTTSARTNGWVIKGAGRKLTTIVFTPSSPGALLKNDNQYRFIVVEGITFVGSNSNATFLDSTSQDGFGVQNYTFRNCEWAGTWDDGFRLVGNASADNNSEWLFEKCLVQGTYTNFLVSGDGGAHQLQDQFVNFDFIGCEIQYTSGVFLNMIYGGAIRMMGGSLILTGTGTVFKLDTADHYSGATLLYVEGQRVELRTATSKLIDSVWKSGTVTFNTCHFDAFIVAADSIIATFDGSGNTGPMVVWDNCVMMGSQEYKFNSASHNAPPGRVTYRNCIIPQFEEPQDSIVNTAIGGTANLGGMWLVDFIGCRGKYTYGDDGSKPGYETSGNWQRCRSADVSPHHRSIKTAKGTLPNSDADVSTDTWLPLNAVILSVWFFLPAGVAGAYSFGGWSYTLRTTEGTPTTIATITSGSGQDLGFNERTVLTQPFMCDTDAKRKLTLVAAANGSPDYTTGLCVVEYLPGS